MKKHHGSYTHNGIMRYIKRLYYKNFIMDYEVYQDKGIWYSELSTYKDNLNDMIFEGKSKKDSENKIMKFFEGLVDSEEVFRYIKNEYSIEPDFEDILYSSRERSVGYHVTSRENRDSILRFGLIPNGNKDPDVANASLYIDKMKPKTIPDWIVRYYAVYAHPEMMNSMLIDPTRKNSDLYAVNIKYDRCWVGSLGLGGFCLFSDDFTQDELEKHIKNCRSWGRLYWNNSCSMNSYVLNTEEFRKKDKRYGLDEILIMHKIGKENIKLIGSWDDNGCFTTNESFKSYIKDKFLSDDKWIDILENYRKGVM